jgi:hypothetical protein
MFNECLALAIRHPNNADCLTFFEYMILNIYH